MGIFSNLFGGSSEENYVQQLAIIENQIKNNDDFYGHWLESSRAKLIADSGLAIPNVILGLIYMNGIHVAEDYNKAESYFKRSIELGVPFAYKYLWVIEIKRGNKEKGEEYMEKGVSAGDPEAMVMLGFYYVHEITIHEGGQPDYKRARSLFEKAARMGHEGAIQNLKIMDQRGD